MAALHHGEVYTQHSRMIFSGFKGIGDTECNVDRRLTTIVGSNDNRSSGCEYVGCKWTGTCHHCAERLRVAAS